MDAREGGAAQAAADKTWLTTPAPSGPRRPYDRLTTPRSVSSLLRRGWGSTCSRSETMPACARVAHTF